MTDYSLLDEDDFMDLVRRFEGDQPGGTGDQLQDEANQRALRSARATEYARRVLNAERGQQNSAAANRIANGADFLFADDTDDVPIWGTAECSMWTPGESLMIFGPPGLGKSTLSHLLSLARIGLITSVLNLPVRDTGGRLLYLAADRPKQIRRAMRRGVCPEYQDVLRERLVVHQGPLPVDICQDKDWLADYAEHYGASTVIIDSIKDVCPKPSGDDEANGYNRARQELIARGIELIENHHNRKASGENRAPNTVDDVYGSRWLTGGAGSILCLWGQPGDTVVRLIHLRGPGELRLPMDILLDKDTGRLTPYEHLELDDLVRTAGTSGISVQELAGRLNGTDEPTRSQIENVRTRLKRRPDKYILVDVSRYRMVS